VFEKNELKGFQLVVVGNLLEIFTIFSPMKSKWFALIGMKIIAFSRDRLVCQWSSTVVSSQSDWLIAT
jgi:hypothetical protein